MPGEWDVYNQGTSSFLTLTPIGTYAIPSVSQNRFQVYLDKVEYSSKELTGTWMFVVGKASSLKIPDGATKINYDITFKSGTYTHYSDKKNKYGFCAGLYHDITKVDPTNYYITNRTDYTSGYNATLSPIPNTVTEDVICDSSSLPSRKTISFSVENIRGLSYNNVVLALYVSLTTADGFLHRCWFS